MPRGEPLPVVVLYKTVRLCTKNREFCGVLYKVLYSNWLHNIGSGHKLFSS
jgi:hypothetical protein